MVQAIELMLKQHNYKVNGMTIQYQACDDSTAQAGTWDSATCSANANAYAQDPSVIGVLGTFNSGCAELEVPVLNRAAGGPRRDRQRGQHVARTDAEDEDAG